ncbi:MAG: LacI family DNA-binding transcriptional regulator [Aureliella sp.]
MSKTVTLNDVATEAGVSPSTASRALSGKASDYRISQSTTDAIQAAADRLGFRPSTLARSLRLKRSGLIGVVVPDIANPFFASIASEITEAAEVADLHVVLADSQGQTEREASLVHKLLARQAEALVVCPVGVESSHLAQARDSGIPVVLVDRTFPDSDFVQVTSQHAKGAEKAIRMLTAQGHSEIGILQGLPGTLPNEARLQGTQKALTEAGIAFDTKNISGSDFTEESGVESARALLEANPNLTAFFAFSMLNAFGALRVARERNLHIPDDISIVAFDDSPVADFMEVPISTVTQDVSRLGKLAGKLIVQAVLGNGKTRRKLHQIDVEVQQRKSISKV